jgi:hypothetical protein
MAMSEGFKITLTAFGAIVVFSVGQIVQRLFIEPVQEQRRVVGRIAYALTFYANAGAIVSIKALKLRDGESFSADTEPSVVAVRGLAADLLATRATIPFYRLMAVCRLVVPYDAVKQASSEMIGWSNNIASGQSGQDNRDAIAKSLKINVKT